MISADFHTHTEFSIDSKASMDSMIEYAISQHLEYICITDHHDIDFPIPPDREDLDFQLDFDNYFSALAKAKDKYAGKINVLCGIELGMQPFQIDKAKEIASKYVYDYVLASSHLANNLDPYNSNFYHGRTEEEAYRAYFQAICGNVADFDDYDCYAHLDYCVRYGPSRNINYSYRKYADEFDFILKTIVQKGKGIEINTAGIRKGLGYCHPQNDVLMKYKEFGGEIITVGSDAHTPTDIAKDFDYAEQILSNIGFKYYTVFKNRKPEFIRL